MDDCKKKLTETHGMTAEQVQQAGLSGLPWPAILALVEKYGVPMAMEILKLIMANLAS